MLIDDIKKLQDKVMQNIGLLLNSELGVRTPEINNRVLNIAQFNIQALTHPTLIDQKETVAYIDEKHAYDFIGTKYNLKPILNKYLVPLCFAIDQLTTQGYPVYHVVLRLDLDTKHDHQTLKQLLDGTPWHVVENNIVNEKIKKFKFIECVIKVTAINPLNAIKKAKKMLPPFDIDSLSLNTNLNSPSVFWVGTDALFQLEVNAKKQILLK